MKELATDVGNRLNHATRGIRESGFAAWARRRPFVGGLLTVLSGFELFFSGQLDIGNIHVQVGIEGFQATVIPIAMVLLGLLAVLMPVHRIFYGVLSLVVAVYSLIGVNLGGFFVGMLLGAVGGVLTVAWAPKKTDTLATESTSTAETAAEPPPLAQRAASAEPAAPKKSAKPGRTRERVAVLLVLCLALGGIGAAKVPDAAPAALCIPIPLLGVTCPPASTPTPTDPLGPILGPILDPLLGGGDGGPGSIVAPLPALPIFVPDPNAPIMTQPAAQLGGSSISFSGLKSVSFVTIPLIDGSQVQVIKLEADDIVIDDFLLDVRRATGPSLVTNSARMELKGNVVVYVDSLTATLLDGTGISLLTNTPPPSTELPPQLLRVNLGLVGVFANSISFTTVDQQIHE
ncbi:MAG: DUF6114 domain-containing protein [Rhodoglobus sp.]